MEMHPRVLNHAVSDLDGVIADEAELTRLLNTDETA